MLFIILWLTLISAYPSGAPQVQTTIPNCAWGQERSDPSPFRRSANQRAADGLSRQWRAGSRSGWRHRFGGRHRISHCHLQPAWSRLRYLFCVSIQTLKIACIGVRSFLHWSFLVRLPACFFRNIISVGFIPHSLFHTFIHSLPCRNSSVNIIVCKVQQSLTSIVQCRLSPLWKPLRLPFDQYGRFDLRLIYYI